MTNICWKSYIRREPGWPRPRSFANAWPEQPALWSCAATPTSPACWSWPGGPLIVNPGSVGLPAYTDDLPSPHAMEAGSPHARSALLVKTSKGGQVDQIQVPYDHTAATGLAVAHARPDWAEWLRTGRADAPAR